MLFHSATIALCLASFPALELELPAIISDGMVIQCDAPIRLWGRGQAGEQVHVQLAELEGQATTNAEGEWQLELDGLPAGGPHELEFRGDNKILIQDLLVGEVWLGSGQSNMAMTAEYCKDFEESRVRADLPDIRMFRECSGPAPKAQWKGRGKWVRCSPDTVGDFSGLLWFFGLKLHKELKVPIGLLDASMSNTPIQCWISAEAQWQHKRLQPYVALEDKAFQSLDYKAVGAVYQRDLGAWRVSREAARAAGSKAPKKPANHVESYRRQGGIGGLFNGKIAPLIPYTLRGITWYQGENNVLQAPLYGWQLPLLVKDWRTRWGLEELPFAWVQLPGFAEGRSLADWQLVRESMRRSLVLENTGMAITIDVGEPTNIHPLDKLSVGERLAAWALSTTYGKGGPSSGPLFESYELRESTILVHFRHAGKGLFARGGHLGGFEIRDRRGSWRRTSGKAENSLVVLDRPKGVEVVALRYGWRPYPHCTLFNAEGYPASPFTTDKLDAPSVKDIQIPKPGWNIVFSPSSVDG